VPAPAPTPAPEPAEVIKWKLQIFCAAGDPGYINATRVADHINTASNGRLVVAPFAGGSIVAAAKETIAAHEGVLEVSFTPATYSEDLFPAAPLFCQVSGGLTAVQTMLWYRTGGGDELLAECFEPLNVVYVASTVETPEVWAHSIVPLETVEDLVSVKFRASGDGGEILHGMGVATVFFPSSEIYEATQRGVIDAFESSGPAINWGRGCHEIADYMYISPSRAPTDTTSFFVNKNAWSKIGPDLQRVVKLAVRDETLQWYAEQVLMDQEAIQMFIDYGVQVQPLPDVIEKAYAEEAVKFYDGMAAEDPFYAKVLESMRAFKAICDLQGIR